MTEQDIRDLLAEIAKQDDRIIDDTAIRAWGEQAKRGGWDRDNALDAVRAFYAWSAEEAINWRVDDAIQPRPVLPYDIHVFVQMRRLIEGST